MLSMLLIFVYLPETMILKSKLPTENYKNVFLSKICTICVTLTPPIFLNLSQILDITLQLKMNTIAFSACKR